ncbi:LacI family transcriptional regulator [Enterococcus faecalis]|uniref:LacI family DNA-binding transcriptional regulator n=1 Tax=Enterococcus faecalis TaxID=1351 RepID=UPI001144E395|nr:LacI family DNA-binding transcriptional regulator [Enterococcus faecalis]NSW10291.1 LacI family DNA-binding transcriptional regulator [Enterococcus faecalis]TQB30335.1 LacI family transcriptional regulator [Enterococcus faecalis]
MPGVRDVAKLAEVSPITVSRVLNNPEKVSKKTKEKVLKAIEELNYSMNPVAKGLSTNKTQVFCVYIPQHIDIRNFYAMELISGISEVCSQNFYSFLMIRDFNTDVSCDGYILTGVTDQELDEIMEKATQKNRKVVLFGTTQKKINAIDVDNYEGAFLMTQYLINHGHKKIGMISLDEEREAFFVKERERGYKAAMEEYKLIKDSNILYTRNNSHDSFDFANDFIDHTHNTAFFCASDSVALGLIRACQLKNINVPKDLSVGGFDGFGYQNMITPHITTIKQPIFDIGSKLTTLILEEIKGRDGKTDVKTIIVEPKLLEGGTIGKC